MNAKVIQDSLSLLNLLAHNSLMHGYYVFQVKIKWWGSTYPFICNIALASGIMLIERVSALLFYPLGEKF